MENRIFAVGKRKGAIAKVFIMPGKGERIVNGKTIKEYLKSETLVMDAEQPFAVLNLSNSYDMVASVSGGGLSGQCGAIRLGCARALATLGEDKRVILRKKGLLTRDSRVKERKKYGLAAARRRYQFSKR
ncbi:MAG: 30S ribosomal protein S9 [Chitinispirillaceae bacterium]|nr:30S ribosomal protein S9 [Chitinispirillaceae bacterium]